jgi:hypothetical protein
MRMACRSRAPSRRYSARPKRSGLAEGQTPRVRQSRTQLGSGGGRANTYGMLAVLVLSLLFALQADPTPAPAASSAPPYPEIGRTHSTTPACAIIRDLAGPSFIAARKADQNFSTIASSLPNYAQVVDDQNTQFSAARLMLISRIDIDVTQMMQDAQVLKKALADPRVAPTITDPIVQAERAQMQQLYDAETARAGPLSEFVTRERLTIIRHDDGDTNAFSGGGGGRFSTPAPTPTPIATATPLYLPQLTGIGLTDSGAMRTWTRQIGASVTSSESSAARLFFTVYNNCR